MKTFACVALAAALGSSSVFAATTECRFIQSRKERNACYDQQSAARQKAGSEGTKSVDPIDGMKSEDDRLTRRLQGICKGC
ncbi:hypothetical protein [Bradyrhizobium sp. LHD-71]|uniref:hypothetical protein n=1 Tax=Bradyrhizobium sp. LHD-71 TaxID=3072141 RepID=UPI00280DFC9A|nr:hypothetical protein [Bradyrhizobium sp. LHD-71]MDQ8731646.1 hypothetical protein [Bradyrhizobium sp. LHD-71]